MKLPAWETANQHWDRFKAFYMSVSPYGVNTGESHYTPQPMVVFETGEVIFTQFGPRPDDRGRYSPVGLEIVTTKDWRGPLYTPDGEKIATAWLYDGGQQVLCYDADTNRVVRVADRWRSNPSPDDWVAGVPHRFQKGVALYVPGPGMAPIGMEKLVAWLPFAKANLTADEKGHIQMIVDTARAALKLTDHAATRMHVSDSISAGCPIEHILNCQTWQDVAEAHLASLYRHGAQRKRMEFDYLLTEQP